MTYGIDTESYYSKTVNIAAQGHYHYLRHPECDIYMVSMVGEDGFRWVGRLEDAPWDRVNEHTWVHHNAAHEDEVFLAAKEKGQMPHHINGSEIHCTADMAAYLGIPRSLAAACEHLLGVKVDKDVRDKMKGRRFETLDDAMQKEVEQYALLDSEYCLKLWQAHNAKWPEWERRLSLLTRRMGQRGVAVDVDLVDSYIGDLSRLVWESNNQIPWSSSAPALSYKRLCEECRKCGIRPPVSLAMDSDDCAEWEEQYGDTYPWVGAMRQKRRANTLLKRFQTLRSRVRPDGRASLPLKYCGANTRRWSGSAGFNAQNMSRDELLGTEARKAIIAKPGHKLVAVDLAQIEPRVLAVISGDTEMLERLKTCDLYEAHARSSMGYDRPESLKSLADIPEFATLRRLSKARVLGASYGAGADKFVVIAKTLAGLDLTLPQAQKVIEDFRSSNPKIIKLWRKLERALQSSVGSDLTLTLPSGNVLTYSKVACRDGRYSCLVSKNGKLMRTDYWGSKLLENLVQAIARDVFAECLLRLEQHYELVLQTHDEGVVEVPVETNVADIIKLMTVPPAWMPDIPLEAEAVEGPNYGI